MHSEETQITQVKSLSSRARRCCEFISWFSFSDADLEQLCLDMKRSYNA